MSEKEARPPGRVNWDFEEAELPHAPQPAQAAGATSWRDEWLQGALGLSDADSPFPWQVELLERFQHGKIPRALDIPTGLGKTSVMAIWLVARAMKAPIPRRLAYVVDRRAVVDQATTVATSLRNYVSQNPHLARALDLDRPLPISTLRGQHVDNREWLEDPSAPGIIVGTIDMIGSRLLFGGYGISRKMRPYHAGLLGCDTLLVLDEAHLVPPFERLLEAVAAGSSRGLGPAPDIHPLVPGLRLLSLSATGRSVDDALTLAASDLSHPVVGLRVRAQKTIEVRPAVAKGDLAKRLAEEAYGLSARASEPMRAVVFCDTRDDATKVADALRKLVAKQRPAPEVELFVGARRVYERGLVASWLERHGFVAGGGRSPVNTFLVATSAAEVGVDLDADAAVADVVAWERMVQRLGRVNRRGKTSATVVLVPLAGTERAPERRQACLTLLAQLPTSASGVDGSPAALVGLRERSKSDANVARLLVEATTPAPLHPPLTRPLLDAWAMTSLEVHTGRPEVDPWLRGWVDDDEPQTTVVFREHLPLVDGKRLFDTAQLQAFLDAAGPHAAERIETEAWRVMRWLTDRLERVVDDATLPGFLKGADQLWALLLGESQSLPISRARLRDKRDRDRTERALAGATLLVDARLGGLAAGLLDEDAGAPAADQGSLDLTQMDGPVPFRVRRVSALEDAYSPSPGFRLERAFEAAFDEDGGPVAWLVVERRLEEQPLTEAGRSVARRAQGLAEHQSWVESEADAIATRLGLDPSLARALRVAARLHDEGKRAERWQRAFRVPVEDRPLAKSLRAPNIAMLGGYRHELGSLPRVERDAEFLSLDEPLRDLVLHLVAAHHGRARPVLPTDGAEEPPARLIVRAREVALRFDRLSRRFGPWGLAWLESLLRAADQRASRRNDEVGDG